MNLGDFSSLGLAANLAIFMAAAGIVWFSGYKLAQYLDAIADKTGLSEAFVGMLLMGTITSLPEIAAVSTSAYIGNAALATNNLLGSVSINVVLIAVADAVLGRDAITSTIGRPTTIMQGVLVIIALALTIAAVLAGDVSLGLFGAWSLALLAYAIFAFWISARYGRRAPWRVQQRQNHEPEQREEGGSDQSEDGAHRSLTTLALLTALCAATILVAGFGLAQSGDAVAKLTGLGSGIVGLVLIGFATSLPELSSIVSAVRLRRYEMALGDVFGTNILTLGLIFLADLVYAGKPVLNQAGRFEAIAATLGIILTGIFLIGLLERANKTFLRMGYDALAALLTFAVGVMLLYFVQS
ncbi:cation:H+ antiporter [Bradyrhizobium sp. R2.2-H]|jgi:cation:H+ antiporter|uniref:sodium:calcium antiporter n=1 Tax=unclassified Bradyrhizobium TaxID=2631580 RepID=UPI001048BFEC|nr:MULTISPECIES: sodium:calcium antiporter [unclassified Bradyrhizobium]TCU69279.1 cation:H+ antiporter [Bradyrhizobium sp. Y-H1]TCU70771.1 cation:H+ antiporter [Bradyrhizobium sp. R2.2-H]